MNTVLQGFRLSPQQDRLWALGQAAAGTTLGAACALRLRGALDRGALADALRRVAERHEILRTSFRPAVNGDAAVQVVEDAVEASLEVRDLGDGDAVWREATHPAEGLRAVLLRRGDGDHVLHLSLPALLADAATLDTLAAEIGAAYADMTGAGAAAYAEPFQYVDFSEWLHETLESDEAGEGRAFWARENLSDGGGLPDLWPVDGALAATGTAIQQRVMDAATARRLDDVASAHGATAEAWLLAAWRVLLQRHAGEDGFVVGAAADGRVFDEMRGGMGPFTRYLPLRGDVDGAASFASLAGAAGEALRQARAWQAFHAWPETDAGVPTLRFGFDFAELPAQSGTWGAIEWTVERRWHQTERFGLRLSAERVADGELRITLSCDASAVAAEGAARLLRRYATLLDASLADSGARADALPVLDAEERIEVMGAAVGAPAPFPAERPLHALFEAQAARTPGATALVFGAEHVSYSELDGRANRLAHLLRARGIGPDQPVAVLMERSVEMVVALYGILKAGAAYVPVDPESPADRVAYMLEDSAASLVLTQSRWMEGVADGVDAVALDVPGVLDAFPADRPADADAAGTERLAYVIYTSGSTGRPKGAMNAHRGVVNRIAWMQDAFGLTADDAVLQKTPFSFDVSVWEFFWPLAVGARLVIAPPGAHRDPAALNELIQREGITTLHFVPSMLRAWLDGADASRCTSLRRVMSSGEALPADLVARFFGALPSGRLHNLYGPTEAAVDVTHWACTPEVRGSVPIGRPIANTRMYVLDGNGAPQPLGVPGELMISGVQVGRGYWRRPGLTAERFVPDAFAAEPGARMYRTGDRARWRADGTLEYLGRTDFQVKVRGFRIEPGEIEAALLAHAAVREAVVVAREDRSGEKRLVAYLTPEGGAPSAGELRGHLLATLPEYMVPAAFVTLERLPLTASGKLDRRALPAPDFSAAAEAAEHVAPRTPTEEVLAAVWCEVLGIDRVGIDDNYFTVGGDSILSVRIAALARERGVEVGIGDLFTHPTIRQLAEQAASGTSESAALTAILGRDRQPFDLISAEDRAKLPEDAVDAFPLASLQAGMMYHQALTPDAPVYHNVDSFQFRGTFDEAAFRAAVQAAVDRQENLRTSIHLSGFSEPLQVVRRHAEMSVIVEDVRHLDDDAQNALLQEIREVEFRTPFDFATAPLMRMRVHLRADDRFHFTLTECHAINDGWSLTSVIAEIFADHATLMRGEPLPARPQPQMRFRDYIELERTADTEPSRRYWAERLAGFVPGRLPFLAEGYSDATRRGTELVRVDLDTETREGLQKLARRLAVPLKSVLLAAHAKVLGISMGERDVVTGLSANGRPEVAGGADVRGLFLNTVPLRLQLEDGSWADLVRQAFHGESELLPHRRYPIATLQHEHGGESLFSTTFNLVRFHSFAEVMRSGVVEIISGGEMGDTSQTLQVAARLHPVTGEILLFGFNYQVGALTPTQAAELADRYRRVMEAMVADPHARHDMLFPLSDSEQARVLDAWNRTEAEYPAETCIHQLFRAQAERTPDAVAVAFAGDSMTYGALDARANQLARRLAAIGVGPESRVAVCMERGVETVVAILAVLKAGGAYVPMDPAYPAERLGFMLADSGAKVLLTQERLRAGRPMPQGIEVLAVDAMAAELDAESPADFDGGATPRGLAYVIYTSGSTGTPKGVAVEHRGVSNYLAWAGRTYPTASSAVHSSLSFDLTVTSLFVPLVNGGTVELVREAEAVEALAQRLEQEAGIGLLKLTPTHLRVLGEQLQGRRTGAGAACLVVGGEQLTGEQLAFWRDAFPGATLVNEYGPTETVVGCCISVQKLADVKAGPVSIGTPAANTRLYVLDAVGQPVPVGVPGELYIGGAQVARGYLDRPALTAERFVPDAFAAEPGARTYRTGDRARWTEDGALEYLGRLDEQVKIRGFRVELGEIEAVLRRQAGVRDCAVVVREDELVAYVAGDADAAALRTVLQRTMPEYMVPGAFVVMEALPLTTNGKLDRRALPAPELAGSAKGYAAPRTATEETLAAIWAELLKVERVGVDESFADLGGHSILAVRMLSRIRKTFGVDLALRAVFENRTVAALAMAIDAAARPAVPEPVITVAAAPAETVDVSQMSEEEIDMLLGAVGGDEEQG